MSIEVYAPRHITQLQEWCDSPVTFCRDVFGITLDDWQIDAINALPSRDLVALIASKGVGKSFLDAVAGWWFMSTRKLAQVICTSKDSDNLRDGLWKELNALYQKSLFLQSQFEMNSERAFHRNPKYKAEWFMSARGWRKHADGVEQAQALAGIHGPAMLWLGDEAGSYGDAIMASGSAMRANVVPGTGREAKVMLSGNPTDPKGPLFKIDRNRDTWHVVKINGDPDNPKRSTRISVEWAREEIKNHGRTNPWVKVSVFGEWPDVGFMNLLGPDQIDKSKCRNYIDEQVMFSQKRLGVDVARFGDDATVICCRQGLKAGAFLELRGKDTQFVADRVALAMQRTGAEIVFVDEDGLGAGVVDALRRQRVRVQGVHSSSEAADERYYNKRAEMWCGMAEWVKESGQLPVDYPKLEADLVEPTYSFKNGKILIEPKELIKKRIGRSPDWGDAFALTFASVDKPAADPFGYGFVAKKKQRDAVEFDPMRSVNGDAAKEYDPRERGI